MKQQSTAIERTRHKRAARSLASRAWPLLLLAFLVACAGDLDTPGEALRLLGGNLPEAFLGEHYDAALRPAGGLRPYTFALSGGELPPGLELSQGAVRGMPTRTGPYAFTVTVSDANLSKTFLEHKLLVSEIPPPHLTVEMPLTEVRAPVTIRVGIADARDLKGLRTRVRWDPEKFAFVPGSVRSTTSNTVLFELQEADWLQADMAWLGRTQSGERQIFSFQLAPLDVATPGLVFTTEFSGSGTQQFTSASSSAGTRVPAAQPARVEQPVDVTAAASSAEEPDGMVDDDVPAATDDVHTPDFVPAELGGETP